MRRDQIGEQMFPYEATGIGVGMGALVFAARQLLPIALANASAESMMQGQGVVSRMLGTGEHVLVAAIESNLTPTVLAVSAIWTVASYRRHNRRVEDD
jgi:hypothetical protein